MRLLIFLFFFSSSAYSSGYYVNSPAGTVRFNSAASYYQLSYALERAADSNTRAPARLVKDVKYTTGGLRNLLKLKSLTPAGFALSAALVAAEYALDDEGDIVKQGATVPEYQDGYYWDWQYGPNSLTPDEACETHALRFEQQNNRPATCLGYVYDSSTQITTTVKDSLTSSNFNATHRLRACTSSVDVCSQNPPTSTEEVTDSEFETEVLPQIAWGDVSFDSTTNQPVVTPELQEELDSTNNWYFDNYEDNSQTITTTSTATTVINQDNSTTTTEVASQDMPAFCNWAGIVCDLANWFQSEPDLPANSDLPIDEIDIPDGWSYVGLEGCPLPLSKEVMGETVTIEFTPFCEYASLLRPFILGSSIFTAALIVLGARAES